ncbi:MAG: M28 family peptidase, partial [Planctomycetota bacterium]|nr:M28 family peptidase [Planctomycetota bacterium]
MKKSGGGMVLEGAEFELVVELKETIDKTRNVVGLIPGSDPKLRDEVVVIGGHLDHVGEHDGKIFNGADDNASG